MIKRFIKILSIILFLITLIISYLSLVGVKTEKFNQIIINKISKFNKKIKLDLKDIKFLLDPYNFTVNIITKNPTVLLEGNKLEIKEIKTNISLKPLLFNKFSIDNLKITTKSVKIKNLTLLAKSFKSSIELFLLDRMIKDGSLIADITLEFDEKGDIKKDYQITGFIKNVELNFLNKFKIKNLNLEFDIQRNKYSLTEITSENNEIRLSSPLIEVIKNKELFLIMGKILTEKKEFDRDQLRAITANFLKKQNIEKMIFDSENDISFNLNKKLKINDLEIRSEVNLDQLVIKNNLKNLKKYLPDLEELINKIMDSDDENASLFTNFNSKINIKIIKTYIDKNNFINNLSGVLNFKNNKIEDLNLKSIFPNNKKINISIKTNDKNEKITKLFTDYPKPLIKRYDFIKGFEEGFLVYQSVKKDGISKALLTIENFKVRKVPALAKLLSLASLQGIADLLTGEGIRFTDFEMKFSNKKKLTTIEEMYAIGPAVSILMDGYIESDKLISLRGTLVPATTINRTIASLPLLGNILVGKKTGEGVFGVSFKIKGELKNLKTTVNPIKTLTPRFITRTLEKIKKN